MGPQIANFLLRRRWPVFGILIAVSLLAALLATRLRFDFTPQAIFAANDDAVAYSEQFKKTFGYEDAALLVVIKATGDADVLSAEILEWQTNRILDLSKHKNITDVIAVPNMPLPAISLSSPGGLTTRRLVRQLPLTEADETRIRATVADNPLMQGTFVSKDLRLGSMVIAFSPDARQIDRLRTIVTKIEATFAASPPPPGYRLHMTGLAAMRLDIVDSLRDDLLWSVPIAGAVLLVALLIVFRGSASILVPLLAIAMGLAWMLAIIVLMGEHLNIISNVLPLLMMIIGVSNCVHVLSRYAEDSKSLNGDRLGATLRTITRMGPACFLTYATTAIGFASLTAAKSDVLVALGWQAAVGMGLLFLSTIGVHATLLPSFNAPPLGAKISPIGPVVATAGYFVARHPRLTVLLSVAIVGCSLWSGRNVVIDSYHVETYEADHPMMQTLHLVDEHLGGVLPLEISLTADEPERLLSPEIYAKVAQAQAFAFEKPEVLFARSYIDLHQELYAKRKNDPKLRLVMPTLDEQGEQRLARSHKLLDRFSKELHYRAFLTEDSRRARLLLRLDEVGTRRTGQLIARLQEKLAEIFPPESGIVTRITGDAFLNASRMDRFVRDLFTSLLMAAVTMFGIIALLFRSLRVGLIAALPNLTPLFVTLGYMHLRGYDMNASNVIVFAISLGIAVDDSIHFLARFHAEVNADGDVPAAIRRTLEGAGRAIVVTSFLILVGLAVLATSSFLPTQRFAELTAVTIVAALLGDLLLLPGCLALLWKPRHPRLQHADAMSSVDDAAS